MSLGSLIGIATGAVLGFFIPGVGIFMGAALGLGLGMMLDPITPDVNAPSPLQGELQITTSSVGTLISDLLGTAKFTGNLFWYGLERSEEQTEEVGGKGGGETVVTGYKYYMSWAMGLCLGEIDTLYTVYNGEDEVVWEGVLHRPESGGEETITLTDMGSAVLYFGTDDQVANTKLGAALEDPTLNPPYRGLCWVFFDDCYIGSYHRMPTMKFVMRKSPVCTFDSDDNFGQIATYDYNPMHAIWYILHDMTDLPEGWLHDADFLSVAETLYNETRGISILFDRSQPAMSYIEAINSHIDGILRYGTDVSP